MKLFYNDDRLKKCFYDLQTSKENTSLMRNLIESLKVSLKDKLDQVAKLKRVNKILQVFNVSLNNFTLVALLFSHCYIYIYLEWK